MPKQNAPSKKTTSLLSSSSKTIVKNKTPLQVQQEELSHWTAQREAGLASSRVVTPLLAQEEIKEDGDAPTLRAMRAQ
jgi:hypothetical protein